MAFKKRSKAELSSIIIGGSLSIVLAYSGFGVWSLVYGVLIQNIVLVILVFYLCQWSPKLIFNLGKAKALLKFGMNVAGSRMLWYFYHNADFLIIAKLLGDKFLGYYSMAFQLSNMPMRKISRIINDVSFPVFSKLQNDKIKSQAYFLKITKFASLITFPSMVGLFLVSEGLIRVILTDKWLPILVPFKILCLIGVFRSLGPLIPPLLIARGKPQTVLRYNMIGFIVLPASFFIGVKFGLNGVALAWLISYPCVLAYIYRHGLKELDLAFSKYLKNLIPPMAATTFMGITVLAFQFIGSVIYKGNIYVEFIGSCVVGALSYVSYLFIFHRNIFSEIKNVFESFGKSKVKRNLALQ